MDLEVIVGGALVILILAHLVAGAMSLLIGNDANDRRRGARQLARAALLAALVAAMLASCTARPTNVDILANPKVYSYWGNGPAGFEHWMWCGVPMSQE